MDMDYGVEEWLESIESFGYSEKENTVQASFAKAAALRARYQKWLFSKLDDDQNEHDFIMNEILRLQSYSEEGSFNKWGARPTLDDIEYGIVEDIGTLILESETYDRGFFQMEEIAKGGPDIFEVKTVEFEERAPAQEFVNSVRDAWKKGDHSRLIRNTKKEGGLFKAEVVLADPNWDHKVGLSLARDRRVENALRKIECARNANDLAAITKIAKRMSRDNQVLNSSKTFDVDFAGRKRKCGIGLNYSRFCTIMNAVAARAEQLNLKGFRYYKMDEFEKAPPKDGDIYDHGAQQGEFMALEFPAESPPEETWEPLYRPVAKEEDLGDFLWTDEFWAPSKPLEPTVTFMSPPPVESILAWMQER